MPVETPELKIVRFIVPGRPKRWERPSQTKSGRRFSPKGLEDAKRAVAWECARVWNGAPWTGPVRISGMFIFETPAGWPKALRDEASNGRVDHIIDPDIDQLLKLVMDALVGIVVVDDNQFSRFGRSAKRYGSPARSEIVLELLTQPRAAVTPGQRRLEREWASGAKLPIPKRTRLK